MVSDPGFDAFLPKAMAAVNVDDIKQIVRDANEYVARQHLQSPYYSRCSILVPAVAYGLSRSVFAVSAASGGPPLYFFYPARFWIDQKLKRKWATKVGRSWAGRRESFVKRYSLLLKGVNGADY